MSQHDGDQAGGAGRAMPRQIRISELATLKGSEIGVSEWMVVDQATVDRFAEATGDRQWIHVDVERAEAERGGTVAHGYLTLSLVPVMLEQILEYSDIRVSLNYGADRLRFPHSVKVGERIRARVAVLDVAERGENGFQLRKGVTVEIDGKAKPALVMEMLVLLEPHGPQEGVEDLP